MVPYTSWLTSAPLTYSDIQSARRYYQYHLVKMNILGSRNKSFLDIYSVPIRPAHVFSNIVQSPGGARPSIPQQTRATMWADALGVGRPDLHPKYMLQTDERAKMQSRTVQKT